MELISSTPLFGCDTFLVGLLGCMEPLSFAWTSRQGIVAALFCLHATVTEKVYFVLEVFAGVWCRFGPVDKISSWLVDCLEA